MLCNRKVEIEIDDCKDSNNMAEWYSLCQQLLKSSYGMDLYDFLDILNFILDRRLQLLNDPDDTIEVFDGCTFGRNHTIFDIKRINEVSTELLKEFYRIGDSTQTKLCEDLIMKSTVL